jgi:SAM-dependent methyltransferase/ADP-heptose:LPS heptosyltransferase
MWSIARDWQGETAFVIAGGPSVKHLDLSPLKGRKVIVINSAHLTYPDADILFYADQRWWTDLGSKEAFRGRVVTTSGGGPRDVKRFLKIDPCKGIATDPTQLALSRTSVTGAINLAVHLGCTRIVLLGVDGRVAPDGQRHHHGAAYPWAMVKGCFDHHAAEFKAIAPSLSRLGVEVINANPDSAIDVWPKVPFQEVIAMLQRVPARKKTLVVRGMLGIGDCLHQRAVIGELMRKHRDKQIVLQTFYTSMYHDMEDLELQMSDRIAPRIKDSGNAKGTQQWGREDIRISYDPKSTKVNGSLMASQFASAKMKMPAQPDFSLPVKPEWRAAAKALLAKHNAAGKPLLVYRPITLNKLWECPARSPDPVAYAKLFHAIRDRFFVVSVCNLGDNGEYIVGEEQDADLKLHKGEAQFETLAGLFAEARMVFANPGFAPILAQAVGTPVACVYGGHESYRTTNAVGAHLAPTLAIEPVKPCECFERFHKCDKRIDLKAALPKLTAFVDKHSASRLRTLIFGTVFVDSEDKAKLVGQWQRLHKHLNPGCDLLLVDSASPYPWKAQSGVRVHDFGDNIGHLARGGRDGWGRALTYGLQAAIDGGYDYVVHIEGDSLLKRPVSLVIDQMREYLSGVGVVAVNGTKRKETGWAETGLMAFDVDWLDIHGLVKRYDWPNRKSKPEPELVLSGLIGEIQPNSGIALIRFRAERGDKGQITAENAASFDWITHCPPAAFDAFVKAAIPAPKRAEAPTIKLNFGCGENRLTGWCNYDHEIDITQPLPFEDEHADFIFAEHVVEHVDYRAALAFFAECRRVLKPGGVIRIAVPSLENIWKRGDQAYFDFARKWSPSADLRGAMHAIINAHGHKDIWTQSRLEACLFYAGFEDITPCEPGKSGHADLVAVEGHGRVIGERFNWIETAVVEGTKP